MFQKMIQNDKLHVQNFVLIGKNVGIMFFNKKKVLNLVLIGKIIIYFHKKKVLSTLKNNLNLITFEQTTRLTHDSISSHKSQNYLF